MERQGGTPRLTIGRRATALAALAAAALAPAAARADSPATIVYQCADGQHICAIAPSGGTPTQLGQTGTVAGVTRDGSTYGYGAPSSVAGQEGLWEAPVAGGPAREISTKAIGATVGPAAPVMSPDGSAFLEHEQQFGVGITDADSDDIYRFDASAGPTAEPTVIDASTLFGMTYGWLGDAAITAHASHTGLEPPTWACVGYQTAAANHYCASTDPSAKLQSPTSVIAYPSGSPDGSQVVAAVASPGSDGGALVAFDASTGAVIRTVAAPPAGAVFRAPRFSPDGSQIVFESDPASGTGGGSIAVVSAAGGTPTTLTQGSDPFWGGTGSAPGGSPPGGPPTGGPGPGGPTPRPRAPKLTLTTPKQTLRSVRRTRHLKVTCRITGSGTCKVRATISARTARHLKLKVRGKHAKTDTLVTASHRFRKRGTFTLTPKLSKAVVKALGRTKRLKVTLAGTSSAPKHRDRTATRTITLR